MIRQYVTCDACNEYDEADLDADGSDSVFVGSVEDALKAGWQLVEGDPDETHVCPACVADRADGDDDEPGEVSP